MTTGPPSYAANPYIGFIHTTGKRRHLDLILADRIVENYVAYNGSKTGRHFAFAETARSAAMGQTGGTTSAGTTSMSRTGHRKTAVHGHGGYSLHEAISKDTVMVTMKRTIENPNCIPRFG